ncbi:protein disulfide-isomerase tmx3a-like [Aplochiton taeniatus]
MTGKITNVICQVLTLVVVSAYVEQLDDTFMDTKGADEIWLIKFYAPWCLRCEELDPIWYQIGAELKSFGSPVNVGNVDATANTRITKEFKVRGYPAILMLKKDVKYNYGGPRTKDGIMDFANRVSGPVVRALSSQQLFQHVMSRHDVLFLYIGGSSRLKANYISVAKEYIVHTYFFSASKDILPKAVNIPDVPVIAVFKDGTYFTYDEDNDGNLTSWINRERFLSYSNIDSYTLYSMGDTGKLIALAIVEDKNPSQESIRYKTLLERVTTDYKELYSRDVQFGYMEGNDYVNGLVLGEVAIPSLMILNLSNDGYFLPPTKVDTEEQLLQFINSVLEGSIEAQGGNGFLQRIKRMTYDAKTGVMTT